MNVEELRTPEGLRRAAEEARARYQAAEAEWDAANAAYDQAYATWLFDRAYAAWRFGHASDKPVKKALARVEKARQERNRAFLLVARIYQRADEVGYSLWPEGPTEDVLVHRLADLLLPAEQKE